MWRIIGSVLQLWRGELVVMGKPLKAKQRAFLVRPVFLIGFMGAGKSSVARRLARSCKLSSLDLDTYIERSCGRRIADIFAAEGESAFRHMEVQALREVAEMQEPLIVSCGGGVVTTDDAIGALHELGHTVLLEVDADEAASRISDRSSRPLFQDLQAARALCEQRQARYHEAAASVVNTHGKDVFAVTCEVRDVLEKEGVLCRLPQ